MKLPKLSPLAFTVIVGVVLLAVVAGVFWYKSNAGTGSFAACVKAGNPVQDSYPEVCVDKKGNRYTNPDQPPMQ
jgi:hypothetical protein